MKKVLSLGVVGFLLSSGVVFAQTESETGGGIIEGAQNAAAVAAKETSQLLGGTPPVATPVVSASPSAPASAEAEKTPVVPGENAPVILDPSTLVAGTLDKGIISETSKMGEELLILQNRQKVLDQVKLAVEMMGVENALRMYPEYAPYLDTSPMALESQLARVETLNKLREEVAKASGPTQYELEQKKSESETAAKVEKASTDLMSMSIQDATMADPIEPEEPTLTREDVAALIEEARSREQETEQDSPKPDTPAYALVLNEVYGANGQMVAVVTDGTSTYKLRLGDDIPNVGQVTLIDRGAVTVRMTDGDEHMIRFQ